MSYTRGHTGLGATTGIVSVATAVAKVVEDPCLPKVANLVLQLHASEQPAVKVRTSSGTVTTKPPAPPVKGIGLCTAVKPLELALKVKAKPWIAYAAAGSVVVGLLLVGYGIGRAR